MLAFSRSYQQHIVGADDRLLRVENEDVASSTKQIKLFLLEGYDHKKYREMSHTHGLCKIIFTWNMHA